MKSRIRGLLSVINVDILTRQTFSYLANLMLPIGFVIASSGRFVAGYQVISKKI